jgi:dipeptidyl aminopeptidase/acylaminoacyl peptidase
VSAMTDLRERFRSLDRLSAPDHWPEVTHRAASPMAARPSPRFAMSLTFRIALLLIALAVLLFLGVAVAGGLFDRDPRPAALVSNGWIAISANPATVGSGEAGDIYRVEDGEATMIIGSADDKVAQACPRFSPDGTRLAYAEARASGPVTTFRGVWPVSERAVVVVGLTEGGEATAPIMRASLPAERGELACPEWSPNGRQVAFRVGAELWIADAASGETTVVPVEEASWGQGEFAWSRDGSRIAVSERGMIDVVSVSAGTSTVIAVEGEIPASLGWTAGDARIVYVVTDAPGDGSAVHAVDADGSHDTTLTAEPADPEIRPGFSGAAVSPDGTRIAYLETSGRCTGGSCETLPTRLFVVGLEGSAAVEVVMPEVVFVTWVEWSPDGQRLLVASIDGVVSIDVASGDAVIHSNGDLNLEWSYSEVSWQSLGADGVEDER